MGNSNISDTGTMPPPRPSATPPPPKLEFDSIATTIESFRRGEFVVVLDSQDRENEGDLIIAAQDITTDAMAFMIRHTSGIICTPLTSPLASSLSLPQMVNNNTDPNRTAYTVSIDANHATVTTGISAHDRALTCRTLASKTVHAASFRRPGHVFPLRARDGGVRQRTGHTEAAVELCRLAGKREVGVICELVDDGQAVPGGRAEMTGSGMLRRDGCLKFARTWGLKICTIEDMVDFVVERQGPLPLPATTNGVH